MIGQLSDGNHRQSHGNRHEYKRVYFGKYTRSKVVSDTQRLGFVKPIAIFNVLFRIRGYLNYHFPTRSTVSSRRPMMKQLTLWPRVAVFVQRAILGATPESVGRSVDICLPRKGRTYCTKRLGGQETAKTSSNIRVPQCSRRITPGFPESPR